MLLAISWQLRRRVHPSILIAFLAAGFIVGILIARHVPPALFLGAPWIILAGVLAGVGFWRARVWAVPVVVLAGACAGLWRGSLVTGDLAAYRELYGQTVTLEGKVREDPDLGMGGQVLKLTDVRMGGRGYGGSVWVSVGGGSVRRSDRVSVTGKLTPGFGTFAATMYRAGLGRVTRAAGDDPARDVRDWFAVKVRSAISEPGASLGIGYLVGQKSALPADLSDALVIAGLTHVVVASGYNLTVLVRLARRLFVRHSKYLAALSAGTMIVGFMAVTGLSPSMSRAGLVAGLSLLAWYYGRAVRPLVLLPFAAAVTLAVNPSYLWGDLGWALSFGSFAGVMLLGPLLQTYFFGDTPPGLIRGILGETVAAQLATLPILVLAFGQFSNVSLFTNILVLPLVPLAMLLTFIAGIGAVIVPGAAAWVGLPADWLLKYMVWVTKTFAGFDWATSIVTIGPGTALAAYAVMVGACLYMWRATRPRVEAAMPPLL